MRLACPFVLCAWVVPVEDGPLALPSPCSGALGHTHTHPLTITHIHTPLHNQQSPPIQHTLVSCQCASHTPFLPSPPPRPLHWTPVGDLFSPSPATMSSAKKAAAAAAEENIKVVIRCRPLSSTELSNSNKKIVDMDRRLCEVRVRNPASSGAEPPRVFTLDSVYDESLGQADVYEETCRPIVSNVIQGYNGTIFAYGCELHHSVASRVSTHRGRGCSLT